MMLLNDVIHVEIQKAQFRIRYEKHPIPYIVNKGNGAVSKN